MHSSDIAAAHLLLASSTSALILIKHHRTQTPLCGTGTPTQGLPQVLHCLRSSGSRRRLLPAAQGAGPQAAAPTQPLLPGAPKAEFQRVNTSWSCIGDICPNQQHTKGRLQWKRGRFWQEQHRSHVSHIRLSRQCQTVDSGAGQR